MEEVDLGARARGKAGAGGKRRDVNEGERDRFISAKFTEDNEHCWHLTNECSGFNSLSGIGRLAQRRQ